MKILIECLWPIESGSLFSFGMASGFKENGHDVYCILTENIENKNQWIKTFGNSHIFFFQKLPQKKDLISSGFCFLQDCLQLWKKFKSVSFDLAISTFTNTFELLILKFVKTQKRAAVCHDPLPHSDMNPKAVELYEQRIKRFDEVIVLTKAFLPLMEKKYGFSKDCIHYMRHGLMHYQPLTSPVTHANPKKGINFLFFGRILEYKGLLLLAEAYRSISAKYQNISLTIAGNGNFEPYAEKYKLLPNVNIVNRYIDNEEVSSFFNTGNTVVVLPYINGTQSGVIPIAFEFGNPVISSDIGGLSEQLFDGEYGILFNSGDSSALASAMSLFLEFPDLYQKESEKMLEGKTKLSWASVVQSVYPPANQEEKTGR